MTRSDRRSSTTQRGPRFVVRSKGRTHKPSLDISAILATNWKNEQLRGNMQTLSSRDAKYNFGRLIDTARAEPVTVEKHGRAVVVVLAVEEYERLKTIESEQRTKAPRSGGKKRGGAEWPVRRRKTGS